MGDGDREEAGLGSQENEGDECIALVVIKWEGFHSSDNTTCRA